MLSSFFNELLQYTKKLRMLISRSFYLYIHVERRAEGTTVYKTSCIAGLPQTEEVQNSNPRPQDDSVHGALSYATHNCCQLQIYIISSHQHHWPLLSSYGLYWLLLTLVTFHDLLRSLLISCTVCILMVSSGINSPS
jgi:hypothetical protein